MNRRFATVAATCVLTPLLTLVPSTAHAGSSGSIDHVESDGDKVQVLYSVTNLPTSVTPDLSSVVATVDGEATDATAAVVADDTGVVERTAVLAIDVSNSMRGDRFEAAKQAALTYVDRAPADVSVGLVTFASDVQSVEAPTRDKAALVDAINSLSLTRQTHLYNGILRALDVAGTEGQRTVLLLSDGKDTSSTSLSTVTIAAKRAGVRIDVVALGQRIDESSPLAEIAARSQGTVTSTSDVDDLEALFAKEADALAHQLLVTVELPAGFAADNGNLSVSVTADGTVYSDEAFVSFEGATSTAPNSGTTPAYAPPQEGLRVSRPLLLAGIALLFLGMGTLLAFGMTRSMRVELSPMQQQLSLYTADGMRHTASHPVTQSGGAQLKESAVRMAEGLVQKRDFEAGLATKLDRAGMSLKAAEWLLLHAAIAIGAAFFALLITGGSLLLTLFLFVAGLVLPWFFLSFKASRRMKKFNGALAQTLQIIAGALQAGLSLPQAIDTVVQEGDEAVAGEFRRAIIEQRLGVDIEDSLDSVADRMDSEDFKWVVMAVRIQREVGGNLAELLLTVAATLREREYLRRQVQVLSAEGKMSAYILGGLPPAFFLYLSVARPTYLDPMLHTSLGMLMLGVAAVMMTVGGFWMKQTVKVEV